MYNLIYAYDRRERRLGSVCVGDQKKRSSSTLAINRLMLYQRTPCLQQLESEGAGIQSAEPQTLLAAGLLKIKQLLSEGKVKVARLPLFVVAIFYHRLRYDCAPPFSFVAVVYLCVMS